MRGRTGEPGRPGSARRGHGQEATGGRSAQSSEVRSPDAVGDSAEFVADGPGIGDRSAPAPQVPASGATEPAGQKAEPAGPGTRFRRPGPARRGQLGLTLGAIALGLVVATGLLGASAAEPALPGRRISPPFDFGLNPAAWLVTVLLDVAVVLGAAGLVSAWTALRDGWAPSLRPLVRASYVAAIAAVCVPPMGSADHLVYAAYGRLVTTGGNPYVDTAHTLAARHDPIGLAVQPPWTNTPSVYGPVGTAEQALASWLGGSSVHTTVFVLSFLGALAFIAMGALLRRMGDPRRVTVLFSLNPLLLLEAVNAAHLDAFAALFAVAGLYALHRRRDLVGAGVAGLLIGLGCATKLSLGLAVPAGLWGLGLVGLGVWGPRRQVKPAVAFVLAAAVAGALAYSPYGTAALTPASNSSQMISLGSVWRPLLNPLQQAFGDATARDLISALGWVLTLVLVWLLAPVVRLRPARSGGGQIEQIASADRRQIDSPEPSPGLLAARALALLGLAWVLAAPYTLPWYDVLAWAPLVACAAGPVDLLAVARLAVLSLAYLPGLDIPMPPGVTSWADWVRADAAPVFCAAAVVWCVALGVRRRRGPGRTR
jgi:alpha-1,6-mannosyltransferase